MAIGRISSKLPSTHPSFCPTISVTDTNNHSIASVASGTSPAYLTIPASAVDVDGRHFVISVSGRITLYSGASPGAFYVNFRQGNPTANTPWSYDTALYASQSGQIVPFNLQLRCYYDAQAQQLCGFGVGFIGVYQGVSSTNGTFFLVHASVSPNDLTFPWT